jgi:hypothetical protein
MGDLLGRLTANLLEQVLWPLSLRAADLPPETSIESLCQSNLAKVNTEGDTQARQYCAERLLFGVVMLANKLAATEQDKLVSDTILALMWRDAVELSIARTLSFETNIAFPDGETFSDPEFELRYAIAEEKWDDWKETDLPTREAIENFLAEYADEMLWSQLL